VRQATRVDMIDGYGLTHGMGLRCVVFCVIVVVLEEVLYRVLRREEFRFVRLISNRHYSRGESLRGCNIVERGA
jgi:hypothetical protein